jgi:endoglucanase
LVAALGLVVGVMAPSVSEMQAAASTVPLSIQVAGNHLVDGSGNTVQLRGVNYSGTEYACIQGWGIFQGPSDAASVRAIESWHTNVVRVPLNEDCWLGINGVPSAVGGAAYRQAIKNYVKVLNNHGLYAILELAAAAPGTTQATVEVQMPDQAHSPKFWTGVANAFKGNPAVLFDLFNEPFPDNNSDTTAAWTCWRDGGKCAGITYTAAGMQELVNTVRATGATNVIMLGGIGYASVLDQWGAYAPTDPDGQLAASFHAYDFGGCTTNTCWNSTLAAIGNVPLITGELGFAIPFIDSYMHWADAHGVSYLAWTWDTWGCTSSTGANCNVQDLVTDYNGTPTSPYGIAYRHHLAAVASP